MLSAPRRQFLRHFAEMLAAMLLGMAVLGWPAHGIDSAPAALLLMATSMTAPIVAWMRHRGHGWARAGEMAGAMYAPAAALALLGAGLDAYHATMVPSMLAVMLLRREDYSRPLRRRSPERSRARPAPGTGAACPIRRGG